MATAFRASSSLKQFSPRTQVSVPLWLLFMSITSLRLGLCTTNFPAVPTKLVPQAGIPMSAKASRAAAKSILLLPHPSVVTMAPSALMERMSVAER